MITSMRRCVACDDLWPWPISSRSFDLDFENRVRSVTFSVLDRLFPYLPQIITTIRGCVAGGGYPRRWHRLIYLVLVSKWKKYFLNSLWPSDAIWQYSSGSPLTQVVPCCLTAPSHYLNQCWLVIKCILWHSPESNFPRSAHEFNQNHEFENCIFAITTPSPWVQWVKHCQLMVYTLFWWVNARKI